MEPDYFLPLAEEKNLIIPIGEWAIRQACNDLEIWQRSGTATPRIALNLSPVQCRRTNPMRIIQETMAAHHVSCDCVELEITESTLMDETESQLELLDGVRELGIRLAIDDFGTGYSSMAYLRRLPVDSIKIDRSFIQDIGEDPDGEAIVAAIIQLAHNLRLEVVAEGIETETQLQFLQSHDCDYGQGFLFSHPVPADHIQGLIKKSLPLH